MGLLDRLGLGKEQVENLLTPNLPAVSPWATTQLPQIVWSDIVGLPTLPMTRADAISIPVVSKARNLICTMVSKMPLLAYQAGTSTEASTPTFLYRTDGAVTPAERLWWTIDDLIFWGYSLWVVVRGAGGQITDAEWVPTSQWQLTDGAISVNGTVLADEQFILFNAGFEGLLNIASRTLRRAIDIEETVAARAATSVPTLELKITDPKYDPTDPEIEQYRKSWAQIHKAGQPAVGVTPNGMELVEHGQVSTDMFENARNANRIDIAGFLGLSAVMLDGTVNQGTLTYVTNDDQRTEFYETSLPMWTLPIEQRLSRDDVVPRGTEVRFQKPDTTPVPSADPVPSPAPIPTTGGTDAR
ncbi:phage portal protein [Curtobacterium sp. MCBD17_040]|uniref:phage portal protein n=1 Tax=Curtobacterium sp. MCBD17_040 TaxID=2175674 RepID=UPI000DA857C7|nr:phage portal protein [Curtobacterium sp. MCBD17_040]WIB64376.1 phage portal protein [Curtobacterium sp. MCBD17_040]